jgi:hypothetical protein
MLLLVITIIKEVGIMPIWLLWVEPTVLIMLLDGIITMPLVNDCLVVITSPQRGMYPPPEIDMRPWYTIRHFTYLVGSMVPVAYRICMGLMSIDWFGGRYDLPLLGMGLPWMTMTEVVVSQLQLLGIIIIIEELWDFRIIISWMPGVEVSMGGIIIMSMCRVGTIM